MKREQEFFVGYLAVPPGIGSFVRRSVLALVLGGAVIGILLASRQAPFDPGVFEFGVYREWVGTVVERPFPRLLVDRPGTPLPGVSAGSSFLLGVFGKRGAGTEVAGLHGHTVSLGGALTYSDGAASLEIEPGSVRDLETGRVEEVVEHDLGSHELVGEILDSKCYSGVMKPGRGKPHRSCARRCLSGGIPPYFIAENADGERVVLLLLDAQGGPPGTEILDWVAKPVRLSGVVRRDGDLRVFLANLDEIAPAANE